MKMKIKVTSTRLRNPFYDHPLMKKSGVHEKSDKAKRRIEKQKLKNREWYEQSVNQKILFMPFIKGQYLFIYACGSLIHRITTSDYKA